jgi:glutamate synthase (NADPH/NADH) small chain
MGKPTGFLEFERETPPYRPVPVRLRDWKEVYEPQSDEAIASQGARCMDCGIPFCMQGCPLGNRIPHFNDLVYRGKWAEAAQQLFATNNFPEFTGRLCPAPCESACVLGIGANPVTIERLEYETVEHAFSLGFPVMLATAPPTGKRVVVVGSGPSGLAAAAQLRVSGHHVTVLERNDNIGGLLRYGIPEFKMEKAILDRRLDVMRRAGITFETNVDVDAGRLTALQNEYDAVVLAIGSTRPRLIPAPGAELAGIFPAMTYLEAVTKALHGGHESPISVRDADVVILGGGDTGADCLGTAHRQGARSVTQIEIMDQPPRERPSDQPWPTMARLFKVTSAHEEGGERVFSTETLEFIGEGSLAGLRVKNNTTGEESVIDTQYVFIAAGFLGPELDALGLNLPEVTTPRATLQVDHSWRVTAVRGGAPVFACGDAVRGQSLIVWAIAEGRSCADGVDAHLMGETQLPAPITPYSLSW